MVGEGAGEGFCERLEGFCIFHVSKEQADMYFDNFVVLLTPCRWRNIAVIDGYDIATGLEDGSAELRTETAGRASD